jgi:predicted transcriptional regulator
MVKGLPQVVAAQLRPLIERWREHVPESSGDDSGESGQRDTASRLRDLQQLLDEGLITTEEFEQKRAAMIQEL